ncbi:MAG UNVERIFIED_CONTAM: hypothetical protein LVQ98_04375 [Rickettsiaceae bacterium]
MTRQRSLYLFNPYSSLIDTTCYLKKENIMKKDEFNTANQELIKRIELSHTEES